MSTPTQTPASATTSQQNKSSGSSSGSSPVFTLFIELVGVIILTILAGLGPRMGKIIAIFMAGLLVLWLVTHASTLKNLIPGTNVSVQG